MIQGTNILVFCDGSFWHGRTLCSGFSQSFGKNKALWIEKLRRNAVRDHLVNRLLQRRGYRVFRAWDNDILRDPNRVLVKLASLLCSERGTFRRGVKRGSSARKDGSRFLYRMGMGDA